MTADLLQKAVKKVLEEMQKKPSQRTLHQGKQTLHQLKQHGASLTNIEITEQNIKAFSAVAKKYDIDYALKKDSHTEPPHYYVFFKAKDKDQLQFPKIKNPPVGTHRLCLLSYPFLRLSPLLILQFSRKQMAMNKEMG